MPFVKTSGKKKTAAVLGNQPIFVGRASELHFIRKRLLEPDVPDYNLVSFYGQGGVGKSTLLNRLESTIKNTASYKEYCLIARVNERQLTPVRVMETFAEQLGLKGDFEKAIGTYKEALRKIRDEREQAEETFGRKATVALAGSLAKSVPLVGGPLSQGAEQVSELIWDEITSRQRLKDARHLENPLQDLTHAFLSEVNKLAESHNSGNRQAQRVLLCFDTFEYLANEVAPWLLDFALEEEINENIIFLIAGREELSHSTPQDPKRWLEYFNGNTLCEIELKTFSREETKAYLSEKNITDETRIERIWQLSHGLPLYLSMLTVNPNGEIDPTADVVHNFLRWIPQEETIKQRVVLDAALFSRPFNRDDLKAFAYVSEEERAELYRWLSLEPFVRSQENGRYSYHDIAQEMFSRYLYNSSPTDCREARRSLVVYYQKALETVEIWEGEHATETEEWLELALALVPQLLLLPEEESQVQAIALVVQVIGTEWETSRSEKVNNILQMLQSALRVQMTERARRTVKHLVSYQSQETERPEWYEAVQECVQKLLLSPQNSLEALVLLHFARARAYREQGKYEKALHDFQHVLELNPRYVKAWYYRGTTLGKLKRYEEALTAYEEAIKLNPHYVAAWNNKGDMLDALERYDEALVAYEETIKLNPHYTRAWYNQGITLWKRERYEEALTAYEEAIKLNPHHADAWYNKGIVRSRLGQDKEALVAFEEALTSVTLNPTIAAGWNTKGDMLDALNRPKEALVAYEEAIKLNPHYAEAWHNKGIILWKLEHYEDVLVCFDQALAIDPRYSNAWMDKGDLLYNFKLYEEVIVCYDKALVIDPQNAVACSSKGATLSWLKRDDEALTWYDKALAINPQNAVTWSNKGYSLVELKRYEEALVCLDKALALNPQNAKPWRHKGKALCVLHRYEEALVCLNKALALDAQYVGAWYNQGAILRQLERYEEALAAYDQAITYDTALRMDPQYAEYYEEALTAHDQAIQMNPQDTNSWDNKGIILYKLGRDKEARAIFEEAIKLSMQYAKSLEEALSYVDDVIKQKPRYALAWYRKGITLWRLGREVEAQAPFDESVKLSLQNKYVSGSSVPRFERYLESDMVPDEYLDTEIVIFLQGHFGSTVSSYVYVKLIGSSLRKLFAQMKAGGNYNPADFGTVLASGMGTPPQELVDEMNVEYNMNEVPMPNPMLAATVQPKSFDDENAEG